MIAAVFTAACAGLGRPVVEACGASEDGVVSEATAFAVGAGVCSTVFLILGVFGLLRPGVLAAAFAGAVVVGARGLRGARRPRWPRPSGAIEAVLQAATAYALGVGFVKALAPVSDLDSLAYHLPLARHYLAAGAVRDVPWMIFARWPHAASLLYMPAEALGLDAAASLAHWTATLALVAAAGGAARRMIGPRAAWAAAALVAIQPALANFSGVPRVESWWALFFLLSQYWLWRRAEEDGRRRLVLAAVLAGLAASVKLLGVMDACLLTAWAAASSPRARRSGRAADAAVFAAVAAAFVVPWVVKTWLATGDPVWPFLAPPWPGTQDAAGVAARFWTFNRWPAGADAAFFLRYSPQFLIGSSVAGLFLSAGAPSPLPAMLAVAAVHAAAVAWNYEAWRYCVPCFPALALAAASGWANASRGVWTRRAAAAAVLVLGLKPVLSLSANNELFGALEARSSAYPDMTPQDAYRMRAIPGYGYYRAVDARLAGERRRVLLFSEALGGLLPHADVVWGSPVYQGLIAYDGMLKPRLQSLRVAYVSVDWSSPDLGTYGTGVVERMRAFLDENGKPVVSDGPRVLYRLE